MPELPDVEINRQYASKYALNKKITNIEYLDDQVLESSKQIISKHLPGQQFTETRRKGKYLVLKTSEHFLVLHFGMTGNLKYFKENGTLPEYASIAIHFENEHALAYIAPRKLGKILVTDDVDAFFEEHEIGEDALKMDGSKFMELLSEKRGGVKSALMDQSLISGIGNVYADEILFQEKLHPKQDVGTLTDSQLSSLYNTIRRVLKTAIRHQANPKDLPKNYLLPHREEGADCPQCSGKIEKITVNSRSSYICPDCQKIK